MQVGSRIGPCVERLQLGVTVLVEQPQPCGTVPAAKVSNASRGIRHRGRDDVLTLMACNFLAWINDKIVT